jgi:hypothetical protein
MKEIKREPNLPAPTDCFGNEQPMATWYECPRCMQKSPLTRQWVGLESDEQILEISKDVWGKDKLNQGRDDHRPFYINFARAIEAKLKEANHG